MTRGDRSRRRPRPQGETKVKTYDSRNMSRATAKSVLLGATAMVTAAAIPGFSGAAWAQEAQQPAAVQEVVVTGSRIARRDYVAQTPIVTVNAEALKTTSQIALEQSLSKLPQFVPGADQFGGAANVQATALSTPGASTLNLRGLGQNRNLVLIDGRRAQPINASMAVDINTLPNMAIQNVEVISGGAAATYGSDAISGVVNFKLRQNFEGVDLDVQYGQSFRGYDREFQVSALVGGNFADGRGNAMLGANYATRSAVFQKDIPFYEKVYTDTTVGGDFLLNAPTLSGGLAGNGGFLSQFSQAALDSVFGTGQVLRTFPSFLGGIGFNPAGTTGQSTLFFSGRALGTATAFASANGPRAPGFTGLGTIENGEPLYKVVETSQTSGLVSNAVYQQASLPLTRYSAFAAGHFDINDHVTAYMQTTYAQTSTHTVFGSNPAVNQYSVSIPYDAATGGAASGHPVPTQFATLLNSRANPNANWDLGRGLAGSVGPRGLTNDTTNYQVLGGFKGTVGVSDWTYDVYASHGKTTSIGEYEGFADLARYQQLISAPNYGAGYNLTIPNRGTFAHCTSGLNPFVTTPISADCFSIINAPITTTTELEQDVVEATVQGKAYDLPAGELRFAVGADYRSDRFSYRPDPDMAQTNITGATIGIFGANAANGETKVWEGYGEVIAPIVRDLPFAKSIEANLGYRYSSYDTQTVGGVSTWKATGDWTVVDWFKIRGGYQVANRAPNTAELFQGGNVQVIANGGDPCTTGQSSWGNTAGNANRALVQQLCATQSGLPLSTFTNQFGNPCVVCVTLDNQTGNPNLKSESAKTWTIGMVLRSPLRSAWLDGLTMSLDYYDIRVTDAIGVLTSGAILDQCYNRYGTNPTYDPTNYYCSLIIRSNTTGIVNTVQALYQNLPGVRTSGFDAQLEWSVRPMDVGVGVPGQLNVNVAANYLRHFSTSKAPNTPFVDYAGTSGDTAFTGGLLDPQFRWKTTTTVSYALGPWSASVRWRHLPTLRSSTNANAIPTTAYNQVDVSARWAVTKTYEVRAGVDNLLNADPPITGATPAVGTSFASTGAGTTYSSVYDVLGRRFFVGLKARF